MVTARNGFRPRPFRPYIYVQTSAHRSGLLSAFAARAMEERYLEVPDAIAAEPLPRQLAMVRRMARAHFAESHGLCRHFGPILGYIYRWCEDDSVLLDPEGNVVEERYGRFSEDGKTLVYLNDQPMEAVVMRF